MAKKWTKEEEEHHRNDLLQLYVVENKTIGEISKILGIAHQTVFDRMYRLGIPTTPHLKRGYLNKRSDIIIPDAYSEDLAEFFGIMLGDGNLTHFQTTVTLGTKEIEYARYVKLLIKNIFGAEPQICFRCKKEKRYSIIYLGSVDLTSWLLKEGLVFNKVESQVGVPQWVFKKEEYMKRFLRGFFDTDGTVYKLKFGIQIAYTNTSLPLLVSSQKMLNILNYRTSQAKNKKLYITHKENVSKFFKEIAPQNSKHMERYSKFVSKP